MKAISGRVESVVIGKRRVGRERDGLFKNALAVERNINRSAAGLAKIIDLEVIAGRLKPRAIVRFRGGETDSGQPVNSVRLSAAAESVNIPARCRAAYDAASQCALCGITRKHVARGAVTKIANRGTSMNSCALVARVNTLTRSCLNLQDYHFSSVRPYYFGEVGRWKEMHLRVAAVATPAPSMRASYRVCRKISSNF